MFRILVFVIQACGYEVRCALESQDAGEVRMSKILRLIKECQFGIHDISRTALDPENGLPRFNMPLELGLFLGAAYFGNPVQRQKHTLVLDSERFRYQKFISDIAGQDIKPHGNDPGRVVYAVRDWLNVFAKDTLLPGGKTLLRLYKRFTADVPQMIHKLNFHEADISFADWLWLVRDWLQKATR
ncbi:hypothetical protein [Prosthecobacter sp.]|uniref:hypothetical protein n=1 Tax=Prosthecobacter sp. TaxID=1965333 RepID=UPI0039046E90